MERETVQSAETAAATIDVAPAAPRLDMTPAGILALQGLAGNRAVARTVARTRLLARDTGILHQGYATGDVWGVAAMLAHDKKRHVFVSYLEEDRGKAEGIIKIYQESGIPETRIHRVPLVPGDKPFTRAHEVRRAYNHGKPRRDWIADDIKELTFGTTWVGRNFSQAMRDDVRGAWGVADLDAVDAAIGTWLANRGLATPPDNTGKVLVIWSRFSGKRGDAHIEHDTSYAGVRQIIDEAKKAGYAAVLITGDRSHGFKRVEDTTPVPAPVAAAVPTAKGAWGGAKTLAEKLAGPQPVQAPAPAKRYKDPQAEKYAQMAKAKSAEGFKVIDVTQFWNDADTAAWLPAKSRTGQFKLFEYLHRHFADVRHLGFRSGNLEAMALLGYRVRYLEEPGRAGGMTRMEQWHEANRPDDAYPIGYERIKVSRPPTRSGRYWLRHRVGEAPNWAPKHRAQHAKPNVGNEARGFQDEDLIEIGKYLRGER